MHPRFYQKIEIFEIPNFNKIPSFTIFFLIFYYFWHFVFYFTYPNLSKNYRIICGVLLEALEILLTISGKFKKFFYKKILTCEILFFSKFCDLLFVFFYFFYFWHFIFNFVYLYLSKYSRNFYFFILCIGDFIKEFLKIMECFLKKYRHLKSKILHKFHRLLFCDFIFDVLLAFVNLCDWSFFILK